jgi:nitrite reductase (NADH) large subunit
VTAADHVRRHHATCEIDLVGGEPHHLYNRMAITRLIYGRSGMQGLHLLPDSWYDDNGVICWLNTRVDRIDLAARAVVLATASASSTTG